MIRIKLRNPVQVVRTPGSPRSRPDDGLNPDALIEDYLDRVLARLVDRIHYTRRQEIREELKDHLIALSEAREALGEPHEIAVREALRQFGDPRRHSRQWVREQKTTTLPPFNKAAGWSMAFFGSLYLLLALSSVLPSTFPSFWDLTGGPLSFIQIAVVVPVIGGVLIGWLIQRRPALITFYAIVALILFSLLYIESNIPIRETLWGGADLLLVEYVFWLPIACAAAWVGGWLRNRAHPVSGLARE